MSEQIQINEQDARTATLDGLISAVEWLKDHPDIPLPAIDKLSIYAWDSKEEASRMARAMGTCEKSYDDHFFRLTRSFGTVQIEGVFSRGNVCERVVVGTKEVETEEADPIAVAAIPKVKIKKQVEIVEWHCPDSLIVENE